MVLVYWIPPVIGTNSGHLRGLATPPNAGQLFPPKPNLCVKPWSRETWHSGSKDVEATVTPIQAHLKRNRKIDTSYIYIRYMVHGLSLSPKQALHEASEASSLLLHSVIQRGIVDVVQSKVKEQRFAWDGLETGGERSQRWLGRGRREVKFF